MRGRPDRSTDYVVAVDALTDLQGDLDQIPEKLKLAALRAVNRTVERTRTSSARSMRQQVNFPARYLSGRDGRLSITKQATADDLEGVITGRFRPTSLARFTRGGAPGRAGVRVEVAPGFAKFMRRAFLMRLPAGAADLDTRSNLGLALRLRPGEKVENKRRMVQLRGNLYLLYGPSVSQVFASVANDEAPGAAEFLETEFNRLLDVDL